MARFVGTDGDDVIVGKEGPRDVIHGLGGDDKLYGGNQIDRLVGGSGDDWLYGGLGPDTLRGGAGADMFVFTAISDSPRGGGDQIKDFQEGQDKVVLSGAFHDPGTLHFIGTDAFSGTPGEVRYATDGAGHGASAVQIDMDGDRVTDSVINFVGVIHFQASDFSF